MKVVKKKIDNYEVLEYKGTNIYVIENILDDLTCEEFITFIEKLDLKDSSEEPDKLLMCKYLNLSNENPMHSIIDFKIYCIFNKIFEIMTKCNPYIKIEGDTYYILRKIYGETQLHTDEVRAINANYFFNQIRCLAAVIALNDNFEGGVFKFPHQNIEHKMKKGSVILFPPFWTHPHQITTVGENQYRYTITTWGTENIINK
jgi:hypothetical protein